MDPIPAEFLPQSEDAKFRSCPYEERWTKLKPLIVELYTRRRGGNGRTATLPQIVQFMKDNYSFYAAYVFYHAPF